MSDWTPTTEQVRGDYATRLAPHINAPHLEEARREAFDRWIERVKAEAWDEGHHAGQHNEHEYRPERAMTNPYRQEQDA